MKYPALIILLASFTTFAQPSKLVKKNAKLELISEQFKFTEGPASNSQGDIFFTDQPNNHIWKYSAKGDLSLFKENAGRSNGMYFDANDMLYTCADENTELWKIDATGKHEVILSKYRNKKFNGPNDLWIAANQDIYFTDPFYKRPWWNYDHMPQPAKNVYRYVPSSDKLEVVATGFLQPNGIIGDNKVLYVADINDSKIYKFSIEQDGYIGNRELFCEEKSDGMTLDEKGNLYLTNSNGVTIYNKEGRKIHNIPVPESWTANVTFGGKNKKLLFITASDSVYKLKMKVRGI